MVSIIVAVDEDWGIAKDGKIPWKSKEDMAFFKAMTTGFGNNAVVMGRKTMQSLPNGSLPNRENFVMSRQKGLGSIDDPRELMGFDDVWIIGGAQVYSQALKERWAGRIVITRIPGKHDCDLFFDRELLEKDYWMPRKIYRDCLEIEVWYPKKQV